MKNWEKIEQDIFDYIDGLLPADKRKIIEKQIEGNLEVAQFHKDIKSLRSQLKSLQSIKPSPDFDTVLRTRIRMERSINRQKSFFGFSRIPAFALVSAAAVIVLAFLFNTNITKTSSGISDATNMSVPFSSRNSSVVGTRAAGQNGNQFVNYPMDKHLVRGTRGTPIESNTLRSSTSAGIDTSDALTPNRRIRSVDYLEF